MANSISSGKDGLDRGIRIRVTLPKNAGILLQLKKNVPLQDLPLAPHKDT